MNPRSTAFFFFRFHDVFFNSFALHRSRTDSNAIRARVRRRFAMKNAYTYLALINYSSNYLLYQGHLRSITKFSNHFANHKLKLLIDDVFKADVADVINGP